MLYDACNTTDVAPIILDFGVCFERCRDEDEVIPIIIVFVYKMY